MEVLETPPKLVLRPQLPSTLLKTPRPELYYSVTFARRTSKKSQRSGVLVLSALWMEVHDTNGKRVVQTPNLSRLRKLHPEETLSLGCIELAVQFRIRRDDYLSGRCFLGNLATTEKYKPRSTHIPSPNSFLLDRGVYLDCELATLMRPHQLEGTKFMYQCVSGQQGEGIYGCILADSMGLGKTVQTLALLHAVLRPGSGLAERAVVVAPSTLLKHWERELLRWTSALSHSLLSRIHI